MEVLREGYRLPILSVPPLSSEPIPMPSYSPHSIKGKALEEVTLSLVEKGAVELAPLHSLGFYSRLFRVSQQDCAAHSSLDGVSLSRSGLSVYHGPEQCPRRCPVPAQPSPGLRVDAEDGGLRGTPAPLAGHGQPICHLSQSLLFSLFFSLPGSPGSGDRYAAPQLGPSPGVCVPSVGFDSAGPLQAPLVFRRPDDTGLNGLGFRTFWIWQWIVRLPSLTVQIFSDNRTSIVVISGPAGCRFMRGDYPAICQGCWLLCLCSCPGWVGSPPVFAHQLPT